ncbi:MAG: hypothetical protein NWF08_10010 [Candidatus Bathyarchaeota archaeon]|nr:hypothetical protein [Candidatus Bathyarchaeota archaeon]
MKYILIVLGLYFLIGFISGFSRSHPIINKVFMIAMLFFGFAILVIFPLKYFLPKIYWEFREAKSGLINAITYLNIISSIIFVIAGIFLLINVVHSILYCSLSSMKISACFSETINNNLLIAYLLSLFLVIIFRILKKHTTQ